MTWWTGAVVGRWRSSAPRPAPAPFRRPPPPDTPFEWQLPRGLPHPEVPADNPMTTVKVALGRRLFYDTRLSGNGTFACASCHQQAHAFTDGRARAIGSTGQSHPRSAMSLTNVAYNVVVRLGRSRRADARGADGGADVQRASDRAGHCRARGGDRAPVRDARPTTPWFAAAFPGDPQPVSLANIVRAIAAFERTLLSADSPFDRYLYRDDGPRSAGRRCAA